MKGQFIITIDGSPVDEALLGALEIVQVENSLHLPDVATLILHDPRLHWVDDALLDPGRALAIAVDGPQEKRIFDGEIVEIEPSFEPETQRTTIRAFDRLHRLARGRHVRSFVNVTDGDVMQKLAAEARLQLKAGPTPLVHAHLLQSNESNLAFLQRRAAALGYLLYVDGETLHCVEPKSDQQAIELHWGQTMFEFRPRLSTLGQVGSVTVRGWDPAAKREVIGQKQRGRATPQVGTGQSGGEFAQRAFNIDAHYLVANGPVRKQSAADLLAQATADRIGARFVEAEGLAAGNPALLAGSRVEVQHVGNRFGEAVG
jgi:phage protein D